MCLKQAKLEKQELLISTEIDLKNRKRVKLDYSRTSISGHPRDFENWPLTRGWPFNRGIEYCSLETLK